MGTKLKTISKKEWEHVDVVGGIITTYTMRSLAV
jgi:hypothetical protein